MEVFNQGSLNTIYEHAKQLKHHAQLLNQYKDRFREMAEEHKARLQSQPTKLIAKNKKDKENRLDANDYRIKYILEALKWLEDKKSL